MSELFDKEVNVQKEFEKTASGVHASSRKPTIKVCDENETRKKRRVPKIFLMEGRSYKVRVEYLCHGYRTTSGQQFLIH